jgi:hypothetical protein
MGRLVMTNVLWLGLSVHGGILTIIVSSWDANNPYY